MHRVVVIHGDTAVPFPFALRRCLFGTVVLVADFDRFRHSESDQLLVFLVPRKILIRDLTCWNQPWISLNVEIETVMV